MGSEQELLPVTQVDRDAAMKILNHAFRNEAIEKVSGECFDDMVAILARHRLTACNHFDELVALVNDIRAGWKDIDAPFTPKMPAFVKRIDQVLSSLSGEGGK